MGRSRGPGGSPPRGDASLSGRRGQVAFAVSQKAGLGVRRAARPFIHSGATLLSLGETKTRLRPLVGSLEFVQAGVARGPVPVGLRPVQPVAVAGVPSPSPQFV